MQINEFAVEQLKYAGVLKSRADLDFVWFELEEGYLLIYPDGESHHTYHNPENLVVNQ